MKRPHLVPAVATSLMLFMALADWPYAYYQLLRLVVCGVGVYMAILAYLWQRTWAIWLFAAMAALFNPFAPVHLSGELWQPIDVICAIVFVSAGLSLKEVERNQGERTC